MLIRSATPSLSRPAPEPTTILVSVLPQDTLISQPESVRLERADFGTQLRGPRFRTEDRAAVAKADADGNYLPEPGTPQFDQVNVHAVVAGTLQTYEAYAGHELGWSFSGPLRIRPHAGEGKTAYYSRWDDSINFKQWDSPSLGKIVKTSESLDVAAHETGHAILDGIRPGLLAGTESKAFHEGFGDTSALLQALQYPSNLEKILAENGGDFSKPSLVTRLAEEFGTAFNREDNDPNNDDKPYYRTALNEFRYKSPSELPSDSYPPSQPEEVLTSEPHSFSRIWSGAMYSVLGAFFAQNQREGQPALEALANARDALGSIFGRSLDHLPAANLKFRQAAQAMLQEARLVQDGRYFDALAAVLVDRNLVTAEEAFQQPFLEEELVVSAVPQTAQQAQALTRELSLPNGYAWRADKPVAGAAGRQVLCFRAEERTRCELDGFGEVQVPLHTGLTVVVNSEGRVESRVFTPITAEDRADAKREAQNLVHDHRVATPDRWLQTHREDGQPLKARLLPTPEGPPLLQPLPVWD
jgi:hypothetical protein